MSSRSQQLGVPVSQEEKQFLAKRLKAPEGEVHLIYGRIRQGKSTYTARCMYEDLMQGIPVYSNLFLDLTDVEFDQREQFSISLENCIFGKKEFYKFHNTNYHYFDPTTGFLHTPSEQPIQVFDPTIPNDIVRWLNTLVDCSVYYDEGHFLLHSYEGVRQDLEKMRLITETGHMHRKLVIISQRTQSIHVNARGNVNRYFRCRKSIFFFFFLRLQVEEFQDMKGSDVDESDDSLVDTRIYWSNERYWRLFNTHVLREGKPLSQQLYFDAYSLSFVQRVSLVLYHLFGRRGRAGVKASATPTLQVPVPHKPVLEPTGYLGQLKRIEIKQDSTP